MKTLLAVLLFSLAGGDASAKDVSIQNDGGGEITFSQLTGSCEQGAHLAYATTKGGEVVVRGCWVYDVENKKVIVIWHDGTVYEYK